MKNAERRTVCERDCTIRQNIDENFEVTEAFIYFIFAGASFVGFVMIQIILVYKITKLQQLTNK